MRQVTRSAITYTACTIDKPVHCQSAIVSIRRGKLTFSEYRGVRGWKLAPVLQSEQSHTQYASIPHLLQALTSRNVDLESFPAPLCKVS